MFNDDEQENCDEHQPGQEDDEGVEVEVGFALRLRLVIRPDHGQHCHALDIIENNHIISECFRICSQLSCFVWWKSTMYSKTTCPADLCLYCLCICTDAPDM